MAAWGLIQAVLAYALISTGTSLAVSPLFAEDAALAPGSPDGAMALILANGLAGAKSSSPARVHGLRRSGRSPFILP